jgi:hypothetical protein
VTEASPILGQIIDRVHTRQEKWATTFEPALPSWTQINEYALLGWYSICLVPSRKRLVLEDPAIRVDGTKDTPSSLARDYLTIKFGRGPRIQKTQRITVQEGISPHPVYCKPTTFAEGAYIDIEAAYWSILAAVGWNIDYWPKRWLGRRRGVSDFPWPDHKSARNSIVSIGMVTTRTTYHPKDAAGGPRTSPAGNPLANSQLYRLINDTLNAIASDAKRAGAVYIATDGYVAPTPKATERICDLVRSWGLKPIIKGYGPGAVYGVGSYQVGKLHKGRRITGQHEQKPVVRQVDYAEWLRLRLLSFAEDPAED